jgi:hypothetical protein
MTYFIEFVREHVDQFLVLASQILCSEIERRLGRPLFH